RSMVEEIKAHITGVVFQITTKPGDRIAAGDAVIVLESMKMEIPVEAPRAGAIKEIRVREGQTVQEGDVVAVLEYGGLHEPRDGPGTVRLSRLVEPEAVRRNNGARRGTRVARGGPTVQLPDPHADVRASLRGRLGLALALEGRLADEAPGGRIPDARVHP